MLDQGSGRHEAMTLRLGGGQRLMRKCSEPLGAGDGEIVKVLAALEMAMIGEHADVDHGIVDRRIATLLPVEIRTFCECWT
ncbi:hypothetical protein A9D60_24750 [Leisingera sp. JC1]|nr:hypothetical protein A9D60_24750 [Leisingera sp. JC1]